MTASEEPPPAVLLSDNFYSATMQRTREAEWRIRCTSNTFINYTISGKPGESAAEQILGLFQRGWFRAPSAPTLPTAGLGGPVTTLVPTTEKPRFVRRSGEEVQADWDARVGKLAIKGRIILEAAGPQHSSNYVEASIRDVNCIVCNAIVLGAHPFNLSNYDGHCKGAKSGKTHQANVERFEQWCELLDTAPTHVMVSTTKANALHCLICDISLSPRGTQFDTGPYFDHCRTDRHKQMCMSAGLAPIIPPCLLIQEKRKGGILSIWGSSSAVRPLGGGGSGPGGGGGPPGGGGGGGGGGGPPGGGSTGSGGGGSGGSTSDAAVVPYVDGRRGEEGPSAIVATAALDSGGGALRCLVGCSGALSGDRYRSLAETRSNVLQPAREARDETPAKGKGKAKAALAARPAQLAGYSVTIEAGVPVVRADGCKREQAEASPCLQCRKLDLHAIGVRATAAAVLKAKVEYFGALVSSEPPPSAVLELLEHDKAQHDKDKKKKTPHFLTKPQEEQLGYLKSAMFGLRAQQDILSPSFVKQIELLEARLQNFELVGKISEVGQLSPVVRQYVAKVSEGGGGVHSEAMDGLLAMYCDGSLKDSNQALFGMMIAATEKHKREQRGAASARGIPLSPSLMNLLLTLGKHGQKVVKTVSLNLLGYEVDLSNLRRSVPRMLNLPEGKTIELIAPSEDEFELTARMMLGAFDLGEKKLINVHMDPTKLAEALQFCQRRKAFIGGDMKSPKVAVASGQKMAEVVEQLKHLAPADQANILAISPAVSGYCAFELAAIPERHARKGLSEEQRAMLHPPTTALMVFEQTDVFLRILDKCGAYVVSFGADGGVHGMLVIESLHRVDGPRLSIVASRKEEPLEGTLAGQFGIKLVICKTYRGKVVTGLLDPSHIYKRNEEAVASGTRFPQLGPMHAVTLGFWAQAGVREAVVVKPDAMSDELTQAAYSAEVMQQLLDNSPPAIDPTGTILYLFVVGEALDCVIFDGFPDLDRVARLFLAETFIATMREYVKDEEPGRVGVLAMHALPTANFIKFCNGFIASALEWNCDYPEEPQYTPGMGSLRLETRYSTRRDKTDSFGLLELASMHLNDIAVSSAIASGKVKAPTSAKGYKSNEVREMQPSAYTSTPRPVLQTVMLGVDRLCRLLFKEKLAVDTSGAKVARASSEPVAVPLEPVAGDAPAGTAAALLAEAEEDLETLEVQGNLPVGSGFDELEQCMEQLHGVVAGPAVMAEQVEAEERLQRSSTVAAAVEVSRAAGEAEEEAEGALTEALGVPPTLLPSADEQAVPDGPHGGRARRACSTQRERTNSEWESELAAAVSEADTTVFCQNLIELRKKTAAVAKTKAGQRVRTTDEQQRAFAAQAAAKNTTFLEQEDGRQIAPAALLRQLRQKSLHSLLAFRKQGRLARWTAGSSAAAGSAVPIANQEATIQAGEVWLVSCGPSRVLPCVVYGAFHRFKNGLRPETNPEQPLKLASVESVQIQIFGALAAETADGKTFRATGYDLTREPRRLLSKLAKSRGPFDEVDVSACRTQRLLGLKATAVQRMESLQQDGKIAALWAELRAEPPADDATQQAAQAVAAAAAKAAGRKQKGGGSGAAAAASTSAGATTRFDPTDLVGKKVKKHFTGAGYFIGTIKEYDADVAWYRILYTDGQEEDVSRESALRLIKRYDREESDQ